MLIGPVLIAALAIAAFSDVRSRRIPNTLTVGALLLALAFRAFAGSGPLIEGILGTALALAVVLPLFAMGGVGGGDAKLLIMVGAFLGPETFVVALLAAALFGGGMSLIAAARRGVLLPVLYNSVGLTKWVLTFGRRGERTTLASAGAVSVPYGVAIALGSLVALYWGGFPS